MGTMSNLLFVLFLTLQLNYALPEQECTCVVQRPVPYGFVPLSGNTSILVVNSPTFWYTANERCRNMGLELVKLETGTDIAKLLSYFNDRTQVWIGLRRETRTSEWLWTDGTALNTSSAIYKALTQNSYMPECAYAYRSSNSRILNGYPCGYNYQYACQYKVDEGPRKQIAMLTASSVWETAISDCRSYGGRIPLMKKENEYLRYISDDRISEHSFIWVGLEDVDGDGELKYVDGTRFTDTSFAKWEENQIVNEKAPERVVYVNVTDKKWYISTEAITTFSASYFCEFDQNCS